MLDCEHHWCLELSPFATMLDNMILADCFYSEIKQTVDACVAEALPRLISDVRLTTPVFTLKQGIILTFELVLSLLAMSNQMRGLALICPLLLDQETKCSVESVGLTLFSLLIDK